MVPTIDVSDVAIPLRQHRHPGALGPIRHQKPHAVLITVTGRRPGLRHRCPGCPANTSTTVSAVIRNRDTTSAATNSSPDNAAICPSNAATRVAAARCAHPSNSSSDFTVPYHASPRLT